MTLPIIVLSNQNGREERRGTCSSQPSSCGVVELSRYAGRISAIFVVGVVSRVRGVSGINALNHGRHTPILFQSALAPRADADALSGLLLLPLLGRRFEFFPALKVAGDLLSRLSIAIQLRQKSFRGCSKAFHFLALSAGFTGLAASVGRTPTSQKEIRKCPKSSWRNPK